MDEAVVMTFGDDIAVEYPRLCSEESVAGVKSEPVIIERQGNKAKQILLPLYLSK